MFRRSKKKAVKKINFLKYLLSQKSFKFGKGDCNIANDRLLKYMELVLMEEKIKKEVEEVTRDTLLRLTPKERVVVLSKYHKWLKDVRKSKKK